MRKILRPLETGRRAAIRVLVIVSLVGVPSSAVAATLYVDQANANCSNSGAGSAAQPLCTIGAAVAKTVAGTTVIVSTGDYSENVTPATSGTSSLPIVFTTGPGANVTVSGQTHGFTISGRSWITVRSFNVTDTTGDGFYVTGSSNITISGNHVSYCGQPVSGQTAKGIRLSGVTNSLVSGNLIDHNTDFGIYLTNGTTGVTVSGNVTSYNAQQFQRAAAGIDSYGSSGNTFQGNVSHHNEDSGIDFRGNAANALVVDNVTYSNGDHGIDFFDSPGARIISNSVYKNETAGIDVEGTSSGATIANNIGVDNGINSLRTTSNIRVDSTSTSGTVLDYDIVFLHSGTDMIVWGSTTYTSLAAFVAATGQESHGIQADPLWEAPNAGDLHLLAGSPAIDSANSGASGQTSTDADGNPRVDDPATANTGAGPRAYDDRGAYEFQTGPSPTPTPQPERPPVAALTVNPSSGTAPLTVTADASASTDTDSTPIASYRFDFGDGAVVGPQAGSTATHKYALFATYTVTVTVTDTANLSSTATRQVVVADGSPAAKFSVSPSSGVPPLGVIASACASTDNDGTGISRFSFNFGDGTPAVVVLPPACSTPTHTYTSSGNYTVTVTVTDTANLSSTATARVRVRRK
jgi:parallel beta-helix repeat protein